MFGSARAAYAQVTGSNEPFDNFMEKFDVILRTAGKELEVFNNNLKEVEAQHKFMMEYFMIDKNDEMNDKSESFFHFFQTFFRQVEQALPPEEKKKYVFKTGIKIGTGEGQQALMAELMKKQAQMKAEQDEEKEEF